MDLDPRALGPEALTRDDARRRAQIISDATYDISLDLTKGDKTFGSDTTVRFRCSEPGAGTFVDLKAPSIERITLNGEEVALDAHDGHRIQLEGLQAENVLRVVATCEYSHSGTGLHFFRDPVDGRPYLHSQFEAREAHKVYANFDQPNIKGTFTFRVTAPSEWVVISNTEPTTESSGEDAKLWTFAETELMSSYITAIVAGPYHVVRDQHRDIKLGLYCRQSLAQYLDPDEFFEVTKQGFDFFEEYFDQPYAFGKYDQILVPEFNAGAMENAGCVTFNEIYVFRSKVTDAARESRGQTILHEMAHMWFGDLTTMDWWDDLWLNESFATYMGTLAQARATRWTNAWTTFAKSQKTWAYMQDQLPTTHPIVADVPDTESARTNFDGISYAKGASVLKQLVAWVGEEPFKEGVRNYFRRYRFANADLDKFLGALEESSGRDLSSWSKEWLETAGVNTIRPSFDTAEGKYTRFELEQTAAADWPTLRSHRIAIGLYDLDGDKLVNRRSVELDVVGPMTQVDALVGEPEADLVLVNDRDLAYTKIRFDARSLETLTERLAALPDPLARSLCWTAAIDQVRDGELATRDYVRLLVNNIHTETDISVVQSQLNLTLSAIGMYGDPANRESARAQIAARALEELRKQPAGSDLQLVWARALIRTAKEPEHVEVVRGLLDGTTSFDGLAVDTGLRWLIVQSLAAIGAIGEDEIDAEYRRDPTDEGEREAATARASLPTPEAKATAWRLGVDDESTSFALARSYLDAFQRFDQAHLIEPYIDRYFESLQPMWDTRNMEVAAYFALRAFPIVCMDEELVRRVDEYLEQNPSAAPPVRRYLIENRDNVLRALRARAVDAEAAKRG